MLLGWLYNDPLGLGDLIVWGYRMLIVGLGLGAVVMIRSRLEHRPILRFLSVALVFAFVYWLWIGRPPFWTPWLPRLSG